MTQPLDPTGPFAPIDPFDALRLADGPLLPRADFTSELRTRLLAQIRGDISMTDTITSSASPAAATAPPRIDGLTPYLIVRGGVAALDFYRDAFGAVEEQRFLGDDGRIGHAEIRFGPSKVMLADEYPEHGILGPTTLGGTTCTFHLDLDDVAAVDDTWSRAIALGATSGGEPADQFHGNRSATVVDPFGHRWILTAPMTALSTEEYVAAGAKEGYAVTVADPAPDVGSTPDAAGAAGQVDDVQLKHYEPGDLYYFTIPVADLAKARAFFGAALGWRFDDTTAGHVSNISAPPGGVRPVDERTETQLWFVVDDIHVAVARIRELGGTSDEPVLYDSGWAADCVDDQGTKFSLSVPAAKYSL